MYIFAHAYTQSNIHSHASEATKATLIKARKSYRAGSEKNGKHHIKDISKIFSDQLTKEEDEEEKNVK